MGWYMRINKVSEWEICSEISVLLIIKLNEIRKGTTPFCELGKFNPITCK